MMQCAQVCRDGIHMRAMLGSRLSPAVHGADVFDSKEEYILLHNMGLYIYYTIWGSGFRRLPPFLRRARRTRHYIFRAAQVRA